MPAIAARDQLLSSPGLLAAVERRAPGVTAAVQAGNLREFQRLMVAMGQTKGAGFEVYGGCCGVVVVSCVWIAVNVIANKLFFSFCLFFVVFVGE